MRVPTRIPCTPGYLPVQDLGSGDMLKGRESFLCTYILGCSIPSLATASSPTVGSMNQFIAGIHPFLSQLMDQEQN